MHPAPSVILFSSLSGLGFGLLVWLGLGVLTPTGWVGFVFFTIAYLLAVGGLLASTFHLGHPERALKAFTQWQTSWLSREAWISVAALIVMAIYGAGLVFFDSVLMPLGWLGAALSLGTVFSTAMIYAQLKTVPRWHHWTTPAMFVSMCIAGGALLAGEVVVAMVLLIVAGAVQLAYWISGDTRLATSGTDMASATQLGHIGKVRAFEPPHTGSNYLMDEMVYKVARKHAVMLRVIGLALAAVVPVLLLLIPLGHIGAVLAVLAHLAGVLTTRWLFFAEAEHVVGLYYGQR